MKKTKDDIELSIRAAKLGKKVLTLVAITDKGLALLILKEIAEILKETEKWLKSCAA